MLEHISFDIKSGERLGIVGTTESGKRTVLELLMGLLIPATGKITVDGISIHVDLHPERLLAWRAPIATVPQMIFWQIGQLPKISLLVQHVKILI